jgi:lipid A 4'-phosphatase
MKILSILTIAAIIIFAMFPELDLSVSRYFYDSTTGEFPHRYSLFSNIIYVSVRILCVAVLASSIALLGISVFRKHFPNFPLLGLFNFIKTPANNILICILVVIILTPGVMVHYVFKPLWDRARPVNIVEFGGDKQYTPPFQLMAKGDGNSFVSGHAAMAFSLVLFAFLVDKSKRRRVYIAMVAYGILASYVRIIMGGHYLSDVTFGAILTLWTIHICNKIFLENLKKS